MSKVGHSKIFAFVTFSVKGFWLKPKGEGYEIYKDSVTDDDTKKSSKGLICVRGSYKVLA